MSHTGSSTSGNPAEPATVYLIRHGATEANERRPYILQGRGINGPLSERGQAQADAVATFLADHRVDAVYCSELVRACQTAERVAAAHRLTPQTVADLGEVDVGRWEGMSWNVIREEFPEAYEAFMADCMQNPYLEGESYADVGQRTLPALEEILTRHPGQTVAVVAHNVVNRVCLGRLLDLSTQRIRTLKQSNCCINVIERDESGATSVVTLNSRFHLAHLS